MDCKSGDINESLAKAMGLRYDITPTGDVVAAWKDLRGYFIQYKDPAIFAECIKWLLDNSYEDLTNAIEFAWINGAEIEKAIALAYIKANGENDE